MYIIPLVSNCEGFGVGHGTAVATEFTDFSPMRLSLTRLPSLLFVSVTIICQYTLILIIYEVSLLSVYTIFVFCYLQLPICNNNN